MNTSAHKQTAAEMGLDWSAVLAIYREAREMESADVDRRIADRRDAFKAAGGSVHGGHYKARHRDAFRDGGDATNVAGLDVVAADRGMTADELFAELSADAPGLRPADEVMAEAIARAAAMAGAAAPDTMLPLVQAAAAADITEQWLRQLVKSGRVRGERRGRNWWVSAADARFFARHPTAGRPRFRHAQAPAPF